MDEQRSKRRGKANYWVVIPITSQQIRSNLKEVQQSLESKYKSARSELRKAFTDLDSAAEVHVTLFGVHANSHRLEQVKQALCEFSNRVDAFEIELKGLGAWNTIGGNIVLYADATQQSREKIKALAKELRDFVLARVVALDAAVDGASVSASEQQEEEHEEEADEVEEEVSTYTRRTYHIHALILIFALHSHHPLYAHSNLFLFRTMMTGTDTRTQKQERVRERSKTCQGYGWTIPW